MCLSVYDYSRTTGYESDTNSFSATTSVFRVYNIIELWLLGYTCNLVCGWIKGNSTGPTHLINPCTILPNSGQHFVTHVQSVQGYGCWAMGCTCVTLGSLAACYRLHVTEDSCKKATYTGPAVLFISTHTEHCRHMRVAL